MRGENNVSTGLDQRSKFPQPACERGLGHVRKEGKSKDHIEFSIKIKLLRYGFRQDGLRPQFFPDEIDRFQVNVTGGHICKWKYVAQMTCDTTIAGGKLQNVDLLLAIIVTDLQQEFG